MIPLTPNTHTVFGAFIPTPSSTPVPSSVIWHITFCRKLSPAPLCSHSLHCRPPVAARSTTPPWHPCLTSLAGSCSSLLRTYHSAWHTVGEHNCLLNHRMNGWLLQRKRQWVPGWRSTGISDIWGAQMSRHLSSDLQGRSGVACPLCMGLCRETSGMFIALFLFKIGF